mmetsp:Transcript_20353/g.50614  ORF Transcript_20353/g.50614 Transcript_20353/m.50614 type:complete len:396 (+) Transcript_20353:96-1283(+)
MAVSVGRASLLKRIGSQVSFISKHAGKRTTVMQRSFSSAVDLRSDTVTLPSQGMLNNVLTAKLGDDVMGEDPTVLELEAYMADKFGKERGLYVPTGTMANLLALLSHCDKTRAAEIIIGTGSHINLWEGGNAASIGGIHTRQVEEDAESGELDEDGILDCVRNGFDDHWPITSLLCLENSHNMCGGIAMPKDYFDRMGALAHSDKMRNVNVHVDGARIFNAAVALDIDVKDLCESVDSVSICLSKGLGAPLGSVLVGESDFIEVAKRARKRCGGGMRQAGVVAAMGLYAVQNNVERLAEDHIRAKKIGLALNENGFYMMRNGKIDTNIVYFGLPDTTNLSREEFRTRLSEEYGVKLTGGYSRGGKFFRIVTHMNVDDEGVDRAIEAILTLVNTSS